MSVCGLVEARCACQEEADHDGPHVCECGGSWSFAEDGTFVIERFPQRDMSTGEPLDPFLAIAAVGSLSVTRGPIRYITPSPTTGLRVDDER